MTRVRAIDIAIINALLDGGPSTARQIETHSEVAQACREAKIKARTRIELLANSGAISSDMAYQGAKYWVE